MRFTAFFLSFFLCATSAHAASRMNKKIVSEDDVSGESRMEAPAPERATLLGFDVGYVYRVFDYHEPNMRDSGQLNGLSLGYTGYSESRFAEVRLEGEYTRGDVTYDGQTMSGHPLSETDHDYGYELRALLGLPRDLGARVTLTPYLGIGTRYLNDNGDGPGAYEREISYLYAPIGFKTGLHFGSGWTTEGFLEYDLFLGGKVDTHLSDYDSSLPDLHNTQTDGLGYRVGLDISRRLERAAVHVAPYWQHWQMKDSDYVFVSREFGYGYEPENHTDQYGLSVALEF